MIKVGLYSEDRTLFPLLASALGKDFQIRLETTEDGIKGLVRTGQCDVLLLDLDSNREGIRQRIGSSRRLADLQVPAVILADERVREVEGFEVVSLQALACCRRPPSIRELVTALKSACADTVQAGGSRSAATEQESGSTCDRLVGSSAVMKRLFQVVRRLSNLNVPVSITGESGTGKELIARAIHNLGPRSGQPFVAVSCGAIPETLIESELFGHASGAFTGAAGPHEGYLEKSGEGTLFFDEVGELTLLTQVKLLRVLQELEFSRLGSTRLIPLKARLVFATNQDLSKLVAEGKFRRDLFYRINVMRIHAPALQEHIEDLPLLANHFLRRYSRLFGKPMDHIDPMALKVLMAHPWPGNVRELESVVQRAIIDAAGPSITADDLSVLAEEMHLGGDSQVLDIGDYLPSGTFEKQLRDYKIKLALAAVRENNGNKALAARSLGMSRAYLYRLIGLAEMDTLDGRSAAFSKA